MYVSLDIFLQKVDFDQITDLDILLKEQTWNVIYFYGIRIVARNLYTI